MAGFVRVGSTDEVPEGGAKAFLVAGKPLAVYHTDGQFYCTSDICTHEEESLSQGEVDGEVVECPFHGARFNVRTGAVVSLPAVEPLKTYPVRVDGDQIEIEI